MVCDSYGCPLVLKESERRRLEKGEVRVRTEFAGINYAGSIIEYSLCRPVGVRGEVPGEVAPSVHSWFGGVWSSD